MTATDHGLHELLAGRLGERPRVLVVDSRPTVRQALFLTLDLLGFDVTVAADDVEALLSTHGITPRALIVEAAMWSQTRSRVVDHLLQRHDVRRLSVVILGERRPGMTRDAQSGRLSIHRVPRESDIDELLDLLVEVVASDGTPIHAA